MPLDFEPVEYDPFAGYNAPPLAHSAAYHQILPLQIDPTNQPTVGAPTRALVGAREAFPLSAKEVQEAYESGVVPPGWYTHGRYGQKDLNVSHVIQASKDFNVAGQYAGTNGSIWLIGPKNTTGTIDLSRGDSRDWDRIEPHFRRDYEAGNFPDQWVLSKQDDDGRTSPMTTDEAWENVREQFAPEDIVNSAGAYDNPMWVSWLAEHVPEAGFVHTPDGAVVINPDAAHAIEVVPVDHDPFGRQ